LVPSFEGSEDVLLKGDKMKKETEMEVAISDFLLGFEEMDCVKSFFSDSFTKDGFIGAADVALEEITSDSDVRECYRELAALQYELLVEEIEKMDFQ
jgi:hypothetical protein